MAQHSPSDLPKTTPQTAGVPHMHARQIAMAQRLLFCTDSLRLRTKKTVHHFEILHFLVNSLTQFNIRSRLRGMR